MAKPAKIKVSLKNISEDNPEIKAFLDERYKNGGSKDKVQVEFWACLVFQTDRQRDEFILSLPESIPTLYGCYIDGEAFAKFLGMQLPTGPRLPVNPKKIEKQARRTITKERILKARKLSKPKRFFPHEEN